MTAMPEAGAPAPAGGRRTDTQLAAQLATYIRWHRGEWTTGRATTHLGVNRHRARKALRALTNKGVLIAHEHRGRQFYTLNHA